jgi:hypothetical protein
MKPITSILLTFCILLSMYLWYQNNETNVQLNQTTSILEITTSQLNIIKIELNTTKTTLENIKYQLNNNETELHTTKAQLITTRNQLQETESKYSLVQTQLKTVQNEKTQMLNQYTTLREQINFRMGIGKDSQKFITPENSLVSAKAKEIAGIISQDTNELWRNYKQLYDWVTKNIKYSYDSYLPVIPTTMSGNLTWREGFWRMPEETLADKTGDCEDMAVLLASLLLSYDNGNYANWAIGIKNESTAHLAVAFPVKGDKLTILDPAGNYFTGYQSGYLQSYDVNRAVSDWLAHWAIEMPGAKIYIVFSNTFCREFTNSEEFINWVKETPD